MARLLFLALLICAVLPMAADARPSVVVDADMSFDDAATLAYLAQADRRGVIDLDAVTVSLSGAGYTGRGLSHARCLLRKHGLPGVPVSDGDAFGANPLPEAIRGYVDRVVHNASQRLGELPRPAHGGPRGPDPDRTAGQVHADRAGSADQHRAGARARPLARAAHRARLHHGRRTTHGNLCCGAGDGTDHGQEFNFWADPAAAQRVFSALSGKIYLTALNATDFVPITFDFADRLKANNTTVATATVVTILSDPDVQEYMRQGLMYWWDPLNAAAAITGRFVTYQPTRLSVVQSGVEAGRTVVDPRGARIRLGVAADARAFENHFLATLK